MIEHHTASIFLDEFGHVRFKFKTNVKVELHDAQEYVGIIEELCQGSKKCIILDTRETFASATAEARRFIGADPKATQFRKANALILDSLSVRLIGNFYMKLETPNHPVKIFTDETKALAWLAGF